MVTLLHHRKKHIAIIAVSLVILKKRQVEFYCKVSKQRCSAERLQVRCGSFIAGVLQVAAGGYHY